MNALQFYSSQPWVERLGATLLHFLWQAAVIAGLYAAARRWTSRSVARYGLACAALAIIAAAPLVTWTVLRPAAAASVAASFASPASVALPATLRSLPSAVASDAAPTVPSSFFVWVVAFWIVGALAFWMRLAGGWIFAQRLRSALARPASAEWQQTLDRLRFRLRVSRPVRLLISSWVQAPAVIGWLRPAVLVPVGALAGLPAEQIEALLLHELAHIRRNDYLLNALQSIVEALLFYHPAVWWISGHIRAEREICCDDVAVSVTGDAITYARALAGLEPSRPVPLRAAVAASGGSLAHRIARLVGQSRPASDTLSGPGMVAIAILLGVTAFALFGQPAARPQFEVASVKPSNTQNFQMVRPRPGGLTADAPVQLLLQNAYSVQAFQIVGGPDWIGSDHYAIEAKAASDVPREQIFLMLQSLLEDRFHLKIHHDTKELPGYALVGAKGGPKLSPPKEGGCAEPAPGATPAWAGGRMQPPGQGAPPAFPCGRAGFSLGPGGAVMQGGKVLMPEFVRALSMALGRPVIDKTGFTTPFDLKLTFLPDLTTPAMPPPPPDAVANLESMSPPITSALQQQLGLRLESAKGPVDVIVVDRLERPAAN